MSYTIGVKRRLWFGYCKHEVNGHDWQNGRFILNLVDGSQIHIPGFQVPEIKVYPNFWTHLAHIERTARPRVAQQPAEELPRPEPVRHGATAEQPVEDEDPAMQEVLRRARERVRSISQGYGATTPV